MPALTVRLLKTLLLNAILGSGQLSVGQVHRDSSLIISWAGTCVVDRGYIHAGDTTLTDNYSNRPTTGVAKDATGVADGRVVSLGDGGVATYTLDQPLNNSSGPDFAVFENGFRELTPPYLWFLELAFVEVSSDGVRFVRFPAISETQTETQVGTFGQLDTTAVTHLAGKYPVFYGTPFDLAVLSDSADLDIQHITHIRIVDVVGSLDPKLASYDAAGRAINDPFPTPFRTGGFDLDALAILAGNTANVWAESNPAPDLEVYPQQLRKGEPFSIRLSGLVAGETGIVILAGLTGQVKYHEIISGHETAVRQWSLQEQGLYFISLITPAGRTTKKLVVH